MFWLVGAEKEVPNLSANGQRTKKLFLQSLSSPFIPWTCFTSCLRHKTRARNPSSRPVTEEAVTCGHGPLELGCVLQDHTMLGRFPELKEEFLRSSLGVSYYQLKSCSQETGHCERTCTFKTVCVAYVTATGQAGSHAVGNLMVVRRHR